jgi:excisionase family DNA binding protein
MLRSIFTKPAYNLSDLLELVPVSRSTAYQEIKARRLHPTKVGRRVLFLADDILTWLEHHRSTTAAISTSDIRSATGPGPSASSPTTTSSIL